MNTAGISILLVRLVAFVMLALSLGRLVGSIEQRRIIRSMELPPGTVDFTRRDILSSAVVLGLALAAIVGARWIVGKASIDAGRAAATPGGRDHGALALIAVRVTGLAIIGLSLDRAIMSVVGIAATLQNRALLAWPSSLLELTGIVPLAFGVYLLFGGGWIVRQIDRRSAGS